MKPSQVNDLVIVGYEIYRVVGYNYDTGHTIFRTIEEKADISLDVDMFLIVNLKETLPAETYEQLDEEFKCWGCEYTDKFIKVGSSNG